MHDVTVELLLASPLHRYEGRPEDGPVEAEGRELFESIDLRAGLGIVGDRYFGHPAHVGSAVTVIAAESLEHVARTLGLPEVPHASFTRRNIVLRGVDVDDLRNVVFSLDTDAGPVLFRGHRPANPCAWMDAAIAQGAHSALRGRGGMRCEVLSDGTLTLGPAVLRSSAELGPAPV
ncbi:MAG: MOSC domain-containing protein [Salinibacterium sp.]|nr:MAG: MOSC domain-containing protein [Salinibacterium sp.]